MIFTQVRKQMVPLTVTLIELFHAELDDGVKSQMADAIKVLLDAPAPTAAEIPKGNGELYVRMRNGDMPISPNRENFLGHFWDDCARKLFRPLMELQHRPSGIFFWNFLACVPPPPPPL